MKKKPSELEFISQIKRDGSGVVPCTDDTIKHLNSGFAADEKYKIICLSISEKTYIACGFNSYVVKLKVLAMLLMVLSIYSCNPVETIKRYKKPFIVVSTKYDMYGIDDSYTYVDSNGYEHICYESKKRYTVGDTLK